MHQKLEKNNSPKMLNLNGATLALNTMSSFQKKMSLPCYFFLHYIFNNWYCLPFLPKCKALVLSENVA